MITIIGAGIGGLTTAMAFEKLNIEYQIFEQAPKLNEIGAGIWLAPNALQVLEWLGVLDDVIRNGNTIDRITLATQNLTPLSDTNQQLIKEQFGYSTIAIHRAALQKLLYNNIPEHKITLGKAFQKYEQLDTDRIRITFEDTTQTETDYLIAADGIHSKIRKQLFPDSKTRYSGQTCWRGIASYQVSKEMEHKGMELWGDQIRFGISKIAEDSVYWFAVVLSVPDQKDERGSLKEKLLTMFSDFPPLVQELLSNTSIDKISRNDIHDLSPLKKWHNHTICLIGDAGHSTTPNMGQGGAQAIEDAYYLSNLIAKEQDMAQAFSLFQKKRYKKVNTIVKQSWNTGKMAHWKYGKRLRNVLLKSIPKRFMLKKMIALYQIEK